MDDELKKLREALLNGSKDLNFEDDRARKNYEQGINDAFNQAAAKSGNVNSGSNRSGGGDSKGFGQKLGELTAGLIENTRMQTVTPENFEVIDSFLQGVNQSTSKGFMSLVDGVINTALSGATSYIKEQSFLLTQVNKEIGLAATLSMDFRDAVTRAQPELVRMGVPFRDMSQSITRLVEDTGRFALVGTDMLTRAGEIAMAYGMDMEEIIASYDDFENVGIGAAQAQESIADAGKRSLELGIQSRNTIKGITENIDKLNQYGFANGVAGLEKMVRRATEVRMNLNDVFSVAEKVFDPEGALELSANLQVLGAAFGDFNDPIRLMYMATNEVEGLQTALEGVSQNLATYNTETGGFEVTGANLRQARDIAKALGVELESVTKTAIALQERGQVDMALSGLQISEKDKEFLTNIARMKDGEMQIELLTPELQKAFGGASVSLEKLSQEGVNQLLEYRRQLEPLDEQKLVRQQVTLTENILRDVNYLASLARLEAAGVGDAVLQKFAGMSFKEAGVNISELLGDEVDKLVDKIGLENARIVGEVQKALGLDEVIKEEEKKKEERFRQQTAPTEVKVTHEHNVKADQLMGKFNREWSLNIENYTGGEGYLSPN